MLDYFPGWYPPCCPFLYYCFFHSLSPVCAHTCVSLSRCVSAVFFLPFSPILCLSLPSPASSVKWWTCSPHAVCHCHPSLQSWRWRGWPGCVWSGRDPLALQRRTTSTIFWRWRRKAQYVSHSLFFFLSREISWLKCMNDSAISATYYTYCLASM